MKKVAKKKSKPSKKALNFKKAFKYPFNRPKGMLNILWLLLPIIGWFALGGYSVRIIKGFTKGKVKQLPIMKFGDDFKLGLYMFVKALPFVILYTILMGVLESIGLDGTLGTLIEIFAIPMLTINFIVKQTVSSYFEFGILKYVFTNLGDYIITILKAILLALVYLVMVLVLVGFPALAFTEYIFLADFYRRKVK